MTELGNDIEARLRIYGVPENEIERICDAIDQLDDGLATLASEDLYLKNAATWHDVGHMMDGVREIAEFNRLKARQTAIVA